MGIFSHGINSGTGYSSITENATIESLVEDSSINIDNVSEDFEYEGNEAIATVTENYNSIMMAIGITEASYLERTGREFVYTEGVLGDFLGKIKSFLKKIWEKIKGLFKRFTLMIDKYSMEDKAFVKKYRKELFNGKNLSDFKFKGYKYTIDNNKIEAGLGACTTAATEFKSFAGLGLEKFDDNKMDERYQDDAETVRGDILKLLGGKAGSYTQEEFTKELKEILRNGDSEKEELDNINVGTITGELMTSRDTKKTLDTMFKTSKKAIDQEEKEIERKQKDFLNKQPGEAGSGDKESGHLDIDQFQRDLDDYLKKYPDGTITVQGQPVPINPNDESHLKYLWDNYLKQSQNAPLNTMSFDQAKQVPGLIEFLKNHLKDSISKGRTHWPGQTRRVNVPFTGGKKQLTNDQYNTRAAREFNYYLRAVRDTKTVMLSIQTTVMAALKERSRQNKAICVKIIHYNPKSESYNESYSGGDYSSYSGSNFLAGVELK